MGALFLLNGQCDPIPRISALINARCETFAKSARTGKQINYWDAHPADYEAPKEACLCFLAEEVMNCSLGQRVEQGHATQHVQSPGFGLDLWAYRVSI